MQSLRVLTLLALPATLSCWLVRENVEVRKTFSQADIRIDRIEIRRVRLEGPFVKWVDLDVFAEITNPNQEEMALDRASGEIFLDDHSVANITHERFVRIPPGGSIMERMDVEIPFLDALRAIGRRPRQLRIEADVNVSVLIGEEVHQLDGPVHVTRTFPIPYVDIEELARRLGGRIFDLFHP